MCILLFGLLALSTWGNNHPAIVIKTDSLPVKLELNDISYTVSRHAMTIRPPKALYNYSATFGVGNNAIILYGSVDTIQNKSAAITLNYSNFSTGAIKKALCKAAGYSDQGCLFNQATLSVTYLVDHSWAAVQISLPGIGSNQAVLKLNNGSWQAVAGPGSGLGNLSGVVPQAVAEALGDD